MDAPQVIARGLGKRYGQFHALNNCDLTIEPGQVYGLVGGNGAGKTTLIRTLLGFIRPTSGYSKIGGRDSWSDSTETHRLLSYLPAQPQLPKLMKGRDVLKFFCGIRKESKLQRANQLAEKLDLDLSRWVVLMSTGMRQKLAIAVTLAADVPLVILDEPTANLDPTVQSVLLDEIETIKSAGKTVLFSTHIMSEVDTVCDRVAVLKKGEMQGEFQLKSTKKTHRVTANFPATSHQSVQQQYPDGELNPQGNFSFTTDKPLEEVIPMLNDLKATDLQIRSLSVSDLLGEGFWKSN